MSTAELETDQLETDATFLNLNHYKNKGIYAYICPITVSSKTGDIDRGEFINGGPIEDGKNKDRYYCGKYSTVAIDLSQLEDGFYEVKEAGDTNHEKTQFWYCRLENGDIAQEFATRPEALDAIAPLPVDFPELRGTPKQVKWANDLRARQFRTGMSVAEIKEIQSARLWIDRFKDV